MKKPWGGRFKKKTDSAMERFSASVDYDQRLYAYDIEGSIAHCKMLAKCKIIASAESKKIVAGLNKIHKEIESGRFTFHQSLEDVHMNIESRLIELVGSVGGKLHTGRSRNDQICLDVRLYLRHETGEIQRLLHRLNRALFAQAKKTVDHIIPGYTHMQRAQPVRLAHHLLAYLEMLGRDGDRLRDNLKRIDVMPLGAAALAGAGYPLDRAYVAKLLKFPEISHNSMDAVGDRDFMIEFCANASILMMHLSRFCEELVLWSASEFDFVELSDAFTTGSSIMPQKKNPDAAELTRAKTGRVYGNLVSLLALMKSLPMAYNRDLQEDKEALFDTVDTVKDCLEVFGGMIQSARFKKIPVERLESAGFLTATEMADYLAERGVPFRQAHEITGKAVALCVESGRQSLGELSIAELKTLSPKFKADLFNYLTIEGCVNRKNVYGGTARGQVMKQIARWEKKLKNS